MPSSFSCFECKKSRQPKRPASCHHTSFPLFCLCLLLFLSLSLFHYIYLFFRLVVFLCLVGCLCVCVPQNATSVLSPLSPRKRIHLPLPHAHPKRIGQSPYNMACAPPTCNRFGKAFETEGKAVRSGLNAEKEEAFLFLSLLRLLSATSIAAVTQ